MTTSSLHSTHLDANARKRAVKAQTPDALVRPSRVRLLDPAARVQDATVATFQTRYRRRRANVEPMYSSVIVRVLSRKDAPMDGHVLNLSETGMAVLVDSKIPIGQPVTLEFRVAGLGRQGAEQWPEFTAAAEVVRIEDARDFPLGPYRIALKFVRISTMTQAQISRYVATHSG